MFWKSGLTGCPIRPDQKSTVTIKFYIKKPVLCNFFHTLLDLTDNLCLYWCTGEWKEDARIGCKHVKSDIIIRWNRIYFWGMSINIAKLFHSIQHAWWNILAVCTKQYMRVLGRETHQSGQNQSFMGRLYLFYMPHFLMQVSFQVIELFEVLMSLHKGHLWIWDQRVYFYTNNFNKIESQRMLDLITGTSGVVLKSRSIWRQGVWTTGGDG